MNNLKRILVAEDDIAIADLIRMNLEMVGYDVNVVNDGIEALSKIQEEDFALVILDVMLPLVDGFQIIKKIDTRNNSIIFLTARNELKDKLKGLKEGADDYITKPFEPLELLARVEAVIRRNKTYDEILNFKHIVLNESKRVIIINDREVELTPKEFELFVYLLKNKNIAISRTQLIEQIWGYDFEGETRTIDMHIQKIRKKLDLKENLKTIYKFGYRLEE